METGKVVKDGPAKELMADRDIQEFYLGVGEAGPPLVPRREVLPPEEALERMSDVATEHVEAEPAWAEPLLTFRDVTLRFGGVTALDGVSFEVRPRELFAVIGPNGAGKTSIFNCVNGVYRPQEGSITARRRRADRPRAGRGVARSASRARSRTSGCSRSCR